MVTLTHGFWMGKFEVTQGEWSLLMGAFPREQDKGLFVATGDHLTMFAPTDAAYASLPGFDLDKVMPKTKAERRKVHEQLLNFLVGKVEPLSEIVKRGSASNRAGGHITFKREGNVITADEGFVVIDAPIKASNGVIYPLGPPSRRP